MGQFLDRDQIDALVTHNRPLYEFDVQPGETIVVRGKDRNAYIPGFDATAAIASQIEDSIPDGQYISDGIQLDTGYAYLQEEGDEDGFVLSFSPDDVKLSIYQAGSQIRRTTINFRQRW